MKARRRTERPSLVIAGFIAGMLAAGLVVPFAVGDRAGDTTATQSTEVSRGVSDTEIRVGIPIWDSSAVLGAFGFATDYDVADERAAWEAFFAVANRTPYFGRRIEPVFVEYDALDPADIRRACTVMTEDEQVFAVLGFSFAGDGGSCVAVQHRTLLLTLEAQQDDVVEDADGRIFTQNFTENRNLRVMAADLHQSGALSGKTIGILTSRLGNNHIPVDETLIPTLDELGYRVAHVTTLSEDFGVAQGQLLVEVSQMSQKGVDAVILAANPLVFGYFAQAAHQQGWQPLYLASDFATATNEAAAPLYPESFDGALAVTFRRYGEHRLEQPEAGRDAECIAMYESATGRDVPRGGNSYALFVQICSLVLDMFVPGLQDAGPQLTTEAFSEALQRRGEVTLAFAAQASLQLGKPDAADHVRTVRFDTEARGWIPTDEFHEAPS